MKLVLKLSVGLMGKQFVIKEAEGMQSISKPTPSLCESLSLLTGLFLSQSAMKQAAKGQL